MHGDTATDRMLRIETNMGFTGNPLGLGHTSRMDSLERIRDDVWTRWRAQFARIERAADRPPQATTRVYSTGPIFELKNYTPRRFKPGGRHTAQPRPECDNDVYWLDGNGRPVYMERRHSFNGIDWRGQFQYAAGEAEYAEWCLQTGVCSQYTRVTLEGDLPRTFQQLRVNTAGSAPVWRGLPPARQIDAIAENPMNYSIWLETYSVRDGRIESGEKYTEGLGLPPLRAALTYEYTGDKLERIVQRWEHGEEQTVFAARRPSGARALADSLSRRIANRAVEALEAAGFSAPLSALEMSYQSGESIVPMLIPATEADHVTSLSLVLAIDQDRWITLDPEEFEPELTDFRSRMEKTGSWTAGTRMLREAARQVTRSVPSRVRTSPTFIAFAIDWEAEGDDLESVVRECGATAAALADLKARGWI